MKIALTPLLLLLLVTTASAQQKTKQQPFIIKGQLTDCPDRFLLLSFDDQDGRKQTDTIHIDKNGNFYFKTSKLNTPQEISIRFSKTQIDLNAAPGFNLNFTAKLSDMFTLYKSKKVTGIGSACNMYRVVADSLFCARIEDRMKKKIDINKLKDTEMLADFQDELRLYDSVATAVFNKNPTGETNFSFFKQVTSYELLFTRLGKLLFVIDWFHYNNEKAIRLIKDNFDNEVLNYMFRSEYMLSNNYKNLMSTQYLNYLIDLDYSNDSTLYKNEFYDLEKINKAYKGPIKEYVMQRRINNRINGATSLEKLKVTKKQLRPFIAGLTNANYKKALLNKLDEIQAGLTTIQPGTPAPAFTLQSVTGSTHSLADYKGKVVYLDLWASWCGPCREETPKLKTLHEKYKDDARIAFVSIAVADKTDNWKKAVADDKPTWTQLIDKDNLVADAYVAHSIPKFVIIDKQGNIVNADAPRPSSEKEIEKLLQAEMAK